MRHASTRNFVPGGPEPIPYHAPSRHMPLVLRREPTRQDRVAARRLVDRLLPSLEDTPMMFCRMDHDPDETIDYDPKP